MKFDPPSSSTKFQRIVEKVPEDHPLKEMALLIGSFHSFMNLFGTVVSLMAGSGLERL